MPSLSLDWPTLLESYYLILQKLALLAVQQISWKSFWQSAGYTLLTRHTISHAFAFEAAILPSWA